MVLLGPSHAHTYNAQVHQKTAKESNRQAQPHNILIVAIAAPEAPANDSGYTGAKKPHGVLESLGAWAGKFFPDLVYSPANVLSGILTLATIVLGYFTYKLWGATAEALEHGAASVALANKEFIATHRPILRIRTIDVQEVGGSPVSGRFTLIAVGETLKGEIQIANIGGSEALIQGAHVLFYAAKWPLPMRPPYAGKKKNAKPKRPIVAPGEITAISINHTVDADGILPGITFDPDKVSFFALGWIDYAGGDNVRRRTLFCRLSDQKKHRFVRPEGYDYDYDSED